MRRVLLAVVLSLALPFAGSAKDPFKNLPGVKDPAQEKDVELELRCTSQLERRWPSQFPQRNGLAYRTYRCEEGRVSVGSNRPPNLIEYRKLKQRYQ